MDVTSLNKLSLRNKDALLAANNISCYSCVRYFKPAEIVEWADNGQTGICPNCSVDALLPNVYDIPTLEKANKLWFGENNDC
jgi:hypothetical protein